MGVLEVNVGSATSPDWRKIGCGGSAGTVMTYPAATNTVTIYADNAGTMYGYTNRLTGSGIAHLDMNIDSAQHTFVYQSGDVNGGHAIFTCSIAGSWIGTAVSNAYWRTSSDSFIGFGNWTPSTVQAYTAATTGRLKLWDGTRWMREACDSDGGAAVTDDFNRANSSTSAGANWTTGGNGSNPDLLIKAGINTNQLYPVSSNGGYESFAYDNRFTGADADMSIDAVALGTGGDKTILAFRIAPDGTHFFLRFNQLLFNDASFASIAVNGAGDIVFAAGDRARVVCLGSTIRVYKNGTLAGTYTNTSNQTTGTRHGVGFNSVDTTQRWDNWAISPALERHPLKMWDGTTWQTVACLTPA